MNKMKKMHGTTTYIGKKKFKNESWKNTVQPQRLLKSRKVKQEEETEMYVYFINYMA
jgi:hypothetical protein